ncbi:hypothetical protein [Chryseobacterium joostei]|uniref:hypothetical protein n=1 Tax=Chryseobacterium joostei TaxID=112234 RepID=UPI003D09D58D
MKTPFFILLLFSPTIVLSQNKYENDTDYIKKHCNKKSFNKAQKSYIELQAIQIENSFDTTLKNYYEFLESTKCQKFNQILISAWEKDKIINEKSFNSFFYNSNKNYNIFLTGYTQEKAFRFANQRNLDQGIDNELQFKMLKYVESRSQEDLNKVAAINIEKLQGHELINFISTLEESFGLKRFKKELIDKSNKVNYAFDLDFIISKLLELNIDKTTIENILNHTKSIWDKGNWSEKFWSLIKQQNLKISPGKDYEIDNLGNKKYDIERYINSQQKSGLIGKNPLLFIDYNIINYDEDTLIETLKKYNIKNIETESQEKTISIYGARGKDGVLIILTY